MAAGSALAGSNSAASFWGGLCSGRGGIGDVAVPGMLGQAGRASPPSLVPSGLQERSVGTACPPPWKGASCGVEVPGGLGVQGAGLVLLRGCKGGLQGAELLMLGGAGVQGHERSGE